MNAVKKHPRTHGSLPSLFCPFILRPSPKFSEIVMRAVRNRHFRSQPSPGAINSTHVDPSATHHLGEDPLEIASLVSLSPNATAPPLAQITLGIRKGSAAGALAARVISRGSLLLEAAGWGAS